MIHFNENAWENLMRFSTPKQLRQAILNLYFTHDAESISKEDREEVYLLICFLESVEMLSQTDTYK